MSAQDDEKKFNFLLSHVMDQGPSSEALEAEVVGAMLRRLVVICVGAKNFHKKQVICKFARARRKCF